MMNARIARDGRGGSGTAGYKLRSKTSLLLDHFASGCCLRDLSGSEQVSVVCFVGQQVCWIEVQLLSSALSSLSFIKYDMEQGSREGCRPI
mmetsp:Transcript_33865/g.76106  ORF Transcript_33865/g.76106 Transcript_33865/m.76106 type:complete len:91 (+) Transcript_33865:231-503(+)